MTSQHPVRILFVCLGNICRSPLAEGVFRRLVEDRGLEDAFEIDSAGTGDWHIGESPDTRMQETARRYGITLKNQRARQVTSADLEEYDLVLVMDQKNHRRIQELNGARDYAEKISLFREFDPKPEQMEVPDPYFGGEKGFENVYAIVERTANRLLDHLIDEHRLSVREE